MIVQTTANQFFRVREAGSVELAHVWHGVEMKRVRGAFVEKAKARETLVRKVGARVVEGA